MAAQQPDDVSAEIAEREAKEQGLPGTVDDPVVLAQIARLVADVEYYPPDEPVGDS